MPRTSKEILEARHRDIDGLRQEYSEVNNHIRNHSNLRFTIFTVYLAALGGLLSMAFGLFTSNSENPEQILIGRVGGFLVTVLFFWYELRIQSLINHSLSIGAELELALGYNHILRRPSWGRFRSHHVTIAVFGFLIVFWLILIAFVFYPSPEKALKSFLIHRADAYRKELSIDGTN